MDRVTIHPILLGHWLVAFYLQIVILWIRALGTYHLDLRGFLTSHRIQHFIGHSIPTTLVTLAPVFNVGF